MGMNTLTATAILASVLAVTAGTPPVHGVSQAGSRSIPAAAQSSKSEAPNKPADYVGDYACESCPKRNSRLTTAPLTI
jgi:hypothetical protein